MRGEVFFGAQENEENEEIGDGGQGQVVMKAAPGASLEVIEAEIVLIALKVLFDVVALTAQAQRANAFGRPIKPGGIDMIRGGSALGPIDDEPSWGNRPGLLLEVRPHPGAHPGQPGRGELAAGRAPLAGVPGSVQKVEQKEEVMVSSWE